MGAKTKQVGGGAATPVANNWNQFLNSQLMGGQQPQQGGGINPYDWNRMTTGSVTGASGAPGSPLTPFMNIAQSNAQQPFQQQQSFQGALQGALGGNVRDISGAGGAIQNFFQNQPTPTQFTNPYTAAATNLPQFQQMGTQFGRGETGMANLSQFGNAAQSNINLQAPTPMRAATSGVDLNRGFGTQAERINAAQSNFDSMQGFGQLAPDVQASRSVFDTQRSLGADPSGGAFDAMLMDLIARGGAQEGQSGFTAAQVQPEVQLGQAAQVDLNNPLVAAQLEGVRRAQNLAAADLRARFGAEGAGALGTGAQFAEAQLRSEFAPREAAILQQSIQQQQQQDLAERQAAAQVALGGRGMDVQTAIANMQGGLSGAQNLNQFNTANLGNLLQAATTGRGQNLQTGLGVRGQNLEQLNIGAQQAALNAQLAQQASLANAQNFLQARGLDINQLSLGQQQSLANAQMQQQAAMQNAANQLQARGLDINQLGLQAQQGQFNAGQQNQIAAQNAQNALQAMGLQSQQGMFNAGQANALQQAMLNAQLQNQQLGNQFGLGAQGLNLQAAQQNNANLLANANIANQMNLANAQNTAQFGLGTNQLNANQQQAAQQLFANMVGQGLNLNQLGNQNTMAALAQLFGGFQQSNALGTPQAQMIQQPSAFGQLANAGLQLGSAYLGGGGSFGGIGRGLASLFGGGAPRSTGTFGNRIPLPSMNWG